MATLRIVSFLVLLLLGLLPFGICEPDNREASAAPITPPTPATPLSGGSPGFDYFLLALRWPSDPSVPPQQFTIHGLWPRKNNGQHPEYCTTDQQMTHAILETHKQDLLMYWPPLQYANDFYRSKRFWKHQWDMYGACSANSFPPEAYLTVAINLGRNYGPRILAGMRNAGIMPDGRTLYTNFKVLNAIHEVTGKEASIVIRRDLMGQPQLDEIHLCVDKDGKTLLDCATDYPFIFASPPSGICPLEFKPEIQDKLQLLAGQHVDTLETLSPELSQCIEVLRDLQTQHDEFEAKFLEERAQLEAKYQKLYESLYTKLNIIINT